MRGATKKKSAINEAAQERTQRGLRLAEEHRRYIEPATEAYKAVKQEDMPDHLVASMAICMENTRGYFEDVKGRHGLREDTYTDAVETLQRHGFKIIAALMPSLIAEEIVSVQAMDRRRGEIYYLDFAYGDTKSGVTAGDIMMDARTGQNTTTYDYTADSDLDQIGTGDAGGTTNFTTADLRKLPVRPSTVRITSVTGAAADLVVTDDGAGNLVGDVGAASTIDYATGAIDVTFDVAPGDGEAVMVYWRYDWEQLGLEGVPQVNIDIQRLGVDAVDRLMRARWLIGAAYDLEKVHGRSAQSDLMTALVSEIRHEIDAEIMDMLLDEAAVNGAATISFDKNVQYASGVGKWEYYKELVFTLEEGSEAIFQQTKRGIGNFIVAGQELMQILVGLDDFESAIGPNTQPPSGPHRRGVFRGRWVVYSNPFYPTNKFLLGWKGEGWMNAGAVYAPYMPAFTTPVTALDDLRYRVGTQTSYGKSMINSKFYVEGTITDVPLP